MRSRSIAVLPNAGLGNILFPWAQAQVFGVLNGIPADAIGWSRPHIGPLVRGEKRTRFYGNSFKQSLSEIAASGLLSLKGTIVRNPPLESVADHLKSEHLFVWDQIPHWSDYFATLRDLRDLVKQLVWDNINPSLRRRAIETAPPTIAVHIRCGDFRKLKAGEDFKRLGLTRTPLEYFITMIKEVRRCYGSDAPVTIFTDGHSAELESVLALPDVKLATENKPIVDLLLMSRAQLIIVSASSTFGYWAGFLADSPVLLHPDHIHNSHRPKSINNNYFEGAAVGPVENWPEILIRNIKDFKPKMNRSLSGQVLRPDDGWAAA